MSSLRVETLRLCWLEAFIAVAEEESISGAARVLGIDQSTVSRYMQALEKWLGKKLVAPGGACDPQDAGIYIGITEEGRQFREIAVRVVNELQEFRTVKSKRDEVLDGMKSIVFDLRSEDGFDKRPDVAEYVSNVADIFQRSIDRCHDDILFVEIEFLHSKMRRFFREYEVEKRKEQRRKRGSKPVAFPDFPDAFWEALKARPVTPASHAIASDAVNAPAKGRKSKGGGSRASLDDQLDRLQMLAGQYDRRRHEACFEMAAVVEELLMSEEGGRSFHDALAFGSPPTENATSLRTMVVNSMRLSGGTVKASYFPFCSLNPTDADSLGFEEWWAEDPLRCGSSGSDITRQEFVRLLKLRKARANRPADYRTLLSELDAELGWSRFENTEGGEHYGIDSAAAVVRISSIAAMMRQICHEVLVAYGRNDKPPILP